MEGREGRGKEKIMRRNKTVAIHREVERGRGGEGGYRRREGESKVNNGCYTTLCYTGGGGGGRENNEEREGIMVAIYTQLACPSCTCVVPPIHFYVPANASVQYAQTTPCMLTLENHISFLTDLVTSLQPVPDGSNNPFPTLIITAHSWRSNNPLRCTKVTSLQPSPDRSNNPFPTSKSHITPSPCPQRNSISAAC